MDGSLRANPYLQSGCAIGPDDRDRKASACAPATAQMVAHPDVEARIAEGKFAGSRNNINPHHITTVLRQLGQAGQII